MARRPQGEFLTVPETAAELGISESTVWRLLRSGALASVGRSGRRLVRRNAVAARTKKLRADALRPLDEAHPLWRLVGAARSGGSGPGSEDKHAVLAGE